MKNTKIIIIFAVLLSVINCKAQIYPLNTRMDDIVQGGHVKDLNNDLNQFVGIYKANFEDKNIILYVTKIENKLEEIPNKEYYTDAVVIRYTVKNSSGAVLQDTQNNTQNDFYSIWSAPQENAVVLHYPGTNCGVGWGRVFLFKISSTQLSWEYRPEGRIFVDKNSECPGNPDTKVYLPVTKDLIFTKQ
ncbi:DUF6705 family protein [Chryseobacterium echinoideorum]|uniref:DUF6705 family protein n=1 Tax=Chryseobacterium echinoideorum TaxID=1549648 RepID=UPI0011847C24|nr:DUF6705 family protein [Chryseobacterium echinoideorum]